MARPADPNARESLIAAARAEFARKGLKGTRIEDITAACGLSKGAFYLHFESKEALFGGLVEQFIGAVSKTGDIRRAHMEKMIASDGAVTRHDVTAKTPRYQKMLEFECAEDERLLEHLWAYRDVVGVLISGAQGTDFEHVIWTLANAEVQRIDSDLARLKDQRICRADVPGEVFGSMIVGTYILLALRMSRMQEKPDLAEWARSIHTLLREGSIPHDPRSHA